MSKMIIENRSSADDLTALDFVKRVIDNGGISNNGRQYCFRVVEDKSKIYGESTDLNKCSDRFIIVDYLRRAAMLKLINHHEVYIDWTGKGSFGIEFNFEFCLEYVFTWPSNGDALDYNNIEIHSVFVEGRYNPRFSNTVKESVSLRRVIANWLNENDPTEENKQYAIADRKQARVDREEELNNKT